MKNSELKNKHNHALTQWLKVGIFSLLMLAPLIASVSQWIYASVNKNAKDSYGDKYVQSIQEITNTSLFIEGAEYIAEYKQDSTTTTYGAWIEYTSISVDWTDYGFDDLQYNQFRLFSNYGNVQVKDINGNIYIRNSIWGQSLTQLTFTFKSSNFESWTNGYVRYYAKFYNQNTLDNAFYYGVDQMTKSDLFNWTQNTALYTGIKGMTDNLEIGTPAIAILITYWTILTIAYVIIDILITGFTWITHLIVRND